jgi:hypothetical protein
MDTKRRRYTKDVVVHVNGVRLCLPHMMYAYGELWWNDTDREK